MSTAAILSVIRWRLKGRGGIVAAVAVSMAALLAGSVLAAPGAYAGGTGYSNWHGYIQTTPDACLYLNQTLQQGNIYLPGNPRADSYVSVDGESGCSNHGYIVPGNSLFVTQQLLYFVDGLGYVNCNNGGWYGTLAFTHSISTGYGFNVGGPVVCGNASYALWSRGLAYPPGNPTLYAGRSYVGIYAYS